MDRGRLRAIADQAIPIIGGMASQNVMNLVDTWMIAEERRNEGLNTYNNFAEGLREDRRIDWILASAPVTVDTSAIVNDAENGVPPSDHYPVTATLRF